MCGRSFYSGVAADKKRHESELTRSAHTLEVVWQCPASDVSSPTTRDFFLIHKNYGHAVTQIVEKPNVSLMNVDANKAIFAVTAPGFDVHDADAGPFFYHVQRLHCHEIIELPIQFMVPLAKKVPSSSGKSAMVYNTGRCGSTLLVKMLSSIPGVAGISEPDAFFNVKAESFQARAEILGAAVTLQCKDLTRSNKVAFLKTRSEATFFIREMSVGSPATKLIFMYRDPIKTITSFYAMADSMPRTVVKMFLPQVSQFVIESSRGSSDVINHALLTSRMQTATANMDLLDFYILQFLAHIAAFRHAKARGTVIHVVKYEHLVADPLQRMKQVFNFCNVSISDTDLTKCLRVMKRDSQEGSMIARTQTADSLDRNSFAQEHRDYINQTFHLFGFPDVDNLDTVFQ